MESMGNLGTKLFAAALLQYTVYYQHYSPRILEVKDEHSTQHLIGIRQSGQTLAKLLTDDFGILSCLSIGP